MWWGWICLRLVAVLVIPVLLLWFYRAAYDRGYMRGFATGAAAGERLVTQFAPRDERGRFCRRCE
jgi:hypothetical protein